MTTHHPALEALGITAAQAAADALGSDEITPGYDTAEAIRALLRLRAHLTGHVQPLTAYAPILPPTMPVTIAAEDDDQLEVLRDKECITCSPADVLDALHQIGPTVDDLTHRTLIIDTPGTAALLREVLRTADRHHPSAAVLDWWLQRLEHPGTGATIVAADAAARRWVTGSDASAERLRSTWCEWLNITTTEPLATPAEQARQIAQRAAAGHTLHGLTDCHESDRFAWGRLTRTATRWHRPDSRRDAALGLITRNHAAEHYDSLLLEDPRHAVIAERTGHLVTGTVTALDPLTITSTNPVARLRAGDHVTLWLGEPADVDTPQRPIAPTTVADLAVTSNGTLHLRLSARGRDRALGEQITVRPRRVDPWQQRTLLNQLRVRMAPADNWLTRSGTPAPTHRTVPMDVVLAAAPETDC